MPEPIEQVEGVIRQEARTLLRLPAEGRYVVSAGAINKRRSVDFLIRAVNRESLEEDVSLLLVGVHSPEIVGLLEDEFGHLVRSGRVLSVVAM